MIQDLPQRTLAGETMPQDRKYGAVFYQRSFSPPTTVVIFDNSADYTKFIRDLPQGTVVIYQNGNLTESEERALQSLKSLSPNEIEQRLHSAMGELYSMVPQRESIVKDKLAKAKIASSPASRYRAIVEELTQNASDKTLRENRSYLVAVLAKCEDIVDTNSTAEEIVMANQALAIAKEKCPPNYFCVCEPFAGRVYRTLAGRFLGNKK